MNRGTEKHAENQLDDPDLNKPQTPAELTNRGWLFYAHKDYPRAEAELRKALKANPDDVETLFPLGLTMKAVGASKEAVDIFHRVVSLVGTIPNPVRANMVRRIAIGHINEIETGNWNLEAEIWNKT